MFLWMREYILNAWRNTKGSEKIDQCLAVPSTETENAMSKSKNLSINVISPEGNIKSFNVATDMTINKIKSIAIKHFYGNDASRNPTNFRLVHSSGFKLLADDYNVTDESINENDELVLTKIRLAPTNETLSDEDLKGPSEEAILQVTKDLPIRNPSKYIPPHPYLEDFTNEIRKVLITLVKASAKIILYSPEAPKICGILKEKLEARCKPNINPSTVKSLTERGFSEKKVLIALRLRKSNMVEALKWLTEHKNDPEDDDDDLDSTSVEKECENSEEEENLLNIVDRLLESYHRYRKMDFKPNARARQLLLEMGFEEKNIIEALKITGNNQTNACEWLLGERRPSLQDLDKEFHSDSLIYKAIMADPRIQLSLTSPSMLLVYLSMLESLVAIGNPIRDPKIGPIIDHIMATCHIEKHAIHMNQFDV